MNNHNNIQDELKELGSPLADMPRTMPYSVPDGYFGRFSADMHTMVTGGINLADTNYNTPYSIPTGYFDQLPAQILAAAKKIERTDQKRIAFAPRIQWLTAASLALIISFGSYLMFSTGNTHNQPEKMLAAVPQAEIKSYVQTRYGMDVNTLLTNNNINNLKVDNKDIIAYLNDTGWE